jgi:cell wall-associated NlpC family hydrolase
VRNYRYSIVILLFISLLVLSCSHRTSRSTSVSRVKYIPALELMEYTIQAGAFKNVENAVRLTETLKDHNLDATYFVAPDKLFKVRFGNFPTKEKARQRAEKLKEEGVIEEFYIVQPEDYTVAKRKQYGTNYFREALVKTAYDFIGVPYLWGGASFDDAFDCSGLTMTVYQLNGLNLPRNSARQFEAGSAVDSIDDLQKGDLVFFSARWKFGVSHVGVYIGNGQFIHASSQGKKIRIDSLSTAYFAKHYIGGKTYL